MSIDFKESFEQIKNAGSLAADTLDEVTHYVKPGITTEKLDKICYDCKLNSEEIKLNKRINYAQ